MAYRDSRNKCFAETIEKDIDVIFNMFLKSKDDKYDIKKIIREHFEDDISFLQGISGVILSLLGVVLEDTEYGMLLFVD